MSQQNEKDIFPNRELQNGGKPTEEQRQALSTAIKVLQDLSRALYGVGLDTKLNIPSRLRQAGTMSGQPCFEWSDEPFLTLEILPRRGTG